MNDAIIVTEIFIGGIFTGIAIMTGVGLFLIKSGADQTINKLK